MGRTKNFFLLSIVSVLVLAIGVTVAYFTVRIEGEGKTIAVDTANLKVIFTDTNAEIEALDIEPGSSIPSKTFTVESQTDSVYNYNIIIKDLVNTFVTEGYLQYQIVGTNGGVSKDWTDVPKSAAATDTVLYYSVPLAVGATHSYTINFRYTYDANVDQSADMGKIFSGSIFITEGTEDPNKTLVTKLLENNPVRLTVGGSSVTYEGTTYTPRASFDVTDNQTYANTMYQTNNAEHGDTVYYFAGNVINNWVIFGTCKSATYNCTVGDDLYWRIIRTNEESTGGGIRLLYSGSGSRTVGGHKAIATTTNALINTSTKFNNFSQVSSSNRPDRYAGYMYGTNGYEYLDIRANTQSSTIKEVVDTWYTTTFTENNLKSKIDTKAVYCNDRSYTNESWNSTGSSNNYFGAYGRLFSAKAPSYACGANTSGYGNYFTGGNDNKDRFTGESYTYGNGLLSDAPLALMTVDEAAYAGSKINSSLKSPYAWHYLNAGGASITEGAVWWTLSAHFSDSYDAYNYAVYGSTTYPGYLIGRFSTNTFGVRPVLSLTSDTLWASGNGTVDSPYRIVET